MREQFAGVVVNELRRLDGVVEEVAALLRGKRTLTRPERERATAAYVALKEELRHLRATGTVGGIRRKQMESEERFFLPAVRHALIALRAPTNTNPISPNWAAQLSEARREISYHLDRLERELQ
jgi:hypothetical protein